jgi:hypothetical protein
MGRPVIHGCVLVLILFSIGACTREQVGLPRTPVSGTSPDGRFVAFVRNHPSFDPPSQSIWLGAIGGSVTKLKTLGPDSDWCNTIVWSSDSSTVSYVVQDARLITADAHAVRIVSEKWLTDWDGECPPYRMVRDLSLSAAGREARFRDCKRNMTGPGYDHEASECSSFRTMTIREMP